MKYKTIIAVCGVANKGKSRTIKIVYSLLKKVDVWTDIPAFIRRDMMNDYASLVGVTIRGTVL